MTGGVIDHGVREFANLEVVQRSPLVVFRPVTRVDRLPNITLRLCNGPKSG